MERKIYNFLRGIDEVSETPEAGYARNILDMITIGTSLEARNSIDELLGFTIGENERIVMLGNGVEVFYPTYLPSDCKEKFLLPVVVQYDNKQEFRLYYKTDVHTWTYKYNNHSLTEKIDDLVEFSSGDRITIFLSDNRIYLSDGRTKPIIFEIINNGKWDSLAYYVGYDAPESIPIILNTTLDNDAYISASGTGIGVMASQISQVCYTFFDDNGNESNPSPIATSLDMQFLSFDIDSEIGFKNYLGRISIGRIKPPRIKNSKIIGANVYIRFCEYGDSPVTFGAFKLIHKHYFNDTVFNMSKEDDIVQIVEPLSSILISYDNFPCPICSGMIKQDLTLTAYGIKEELGFLFKCKKFFRIILDNQNGRDFISKYYHIGLNLVDKDMPNYCNPEELSFNVSSNSIDIGGGKHADNWYLNENIRLFDSDKMTPLPFFYGRAFNVTVEPITYSDELHLYFKKPIMGQGSNVIYLLIGCEIPDNFTYEYTYKHNGFAIDSYPNSPSIKDIYGYPRNIFDLNELSLINTSVLDYNPAGITSIVKGDDYYYPESTSVTSLKDRCKFKGLTKSNEGLSCSVTRGTSLNKNLIANLMFFEDCNNSFIKKFSVTKGVVNIPDFTEAYRQGMFIDNSISLTDKFTIFLNIDYSHSELGAHNYRLISSIANNPSSGSNIILTIKNLVGTTTFEISLICSTISSGRVTDTILLSKTCELEGDTLSTYSLFIAASASLGDNLSGTTKDVSIYCYNLSQFRDYGITTGTTTEIIPNTGKFYLNASSHVAYIDYNVLSGIYLDSEKGLYNLVKKMAFENLASIGWDKEEQKSVNVSCSDVIFIGKELNEFKIVWSNNSVAFKAADAAESQHKIKQLIPINNLLKNRADFSNVIAVFTDKTREVFNGSTFVQETEIGTNLNDGAIKDERGIYWQSFNGLTAITDTGDVSLSAKRIKNFESNKKPVLLNAGNKNLVGFYSGDIGFIQNSVYNNISLSTPLVDRDGDYFVTGIYSFRCKIIKIDKYGAEIVATINTDGLPIYKTISVKIIGKYVYIFYKSSDGDKLLSYAVYEWSLTGATSLVVAEKRIFYTEGDYTEYFWKAPETFENGKTFFFYNKESGYLQSIDLSDIGAPTLNETYCDIQGVHSYFYELVSFNSDSPTWFIFAFRFYKEISKEYYNTFLVAINKDDSAITVLSSKDWNTDFIGDENGLKQLNPMRIFCSGEDIYLRRQADPLTDMNYPYVDKIKIAAGEFHIAATENYEGLRIFDVSGDFKIKTIANLSGIEYLEISNNSGKCVFDAVLKSFGVTVDYSYKDVQSSLFFDSNGIRIALNEQGAESGTWSFLQYFNITLGTEEQFYLYDPEYAAILRFSGLGGVSASCFIHYGNSMNKKTLLYNGKEQKLYVYPGSQIVTNSMLEAEFTGYNRQYINYEIESDSGGTVTASIVPTRSDTLRSKEYELSGVAHKDKRFFPNGFIGRKLKLALLSFSNIVFIAIGSIERNKK